MFTLRFPEWRDRALTLSYDDGVEQDIRLMEIMDKHGLKGTFNLNSGLFAPEGTVYPAGRVHRRMTLKRAQELFLNSGHEVAVHGVEHGYLTEMTRAEIVRDIYEDRVGLERDFGGIIQGMAYPYGVFNDEIVSILHSCEILYARTTISSHSFRVPTDWLRLPATCHHADPQLMQLAEDFLSAPRRPENKLFYLWGHSYEFEGADNWHVIEAFAEKMGGHDEVWYATNEEIFNYIKDGRQLYTSADGTKVHNPTARKVWIESAGKQYVVAAGETITLE